MALVAGTVTVADDGSRAGSGLALALYDSMIAGPRKVGLLASEISDEMKLTFRKADAEMASTIASALIAYMTANSEVTVTIGTGDAGLQRGPAAPGDPTLAPSAPVVLAGKGTLA